jgi:hypothetical protein
LLGVAVGELGTPGAVTMVMFALIEALPEKVPPEAKLPYSTM